MAKNTIEVVINKKVYSLSGTESEEYLQQLARYIDQKTRELISSGGYDRLPQDYQSLLLAINLADDYFKCKDELAMMDREAAQRERQMKDLRLEMIDAKIQAESFGKMVAEYKELVQQLQKEVIRLEQRKDDE